MYTDKIINYKNIIKQTKLYNKGKFFNYSIIDDFFELDFANKLCKEFPKYNDPSYKSYKNLIEYKKLNNDWNSFPNNAYLALNNLNSEVFIKTIKKALNIKELIPDNGLHGAGLHIHKNGGKLNPHLDYYIHPKLKLTRKINIIIYLEKKWKEEYGGHLGFYDNSSNKKPGKLFHEIFPKFNRAVIFDTSQNSWHGITRVVKSPPNIYRKHLAIYYLTKIDKRNKFYANRQIAKFSPTEDQANNKEVINLIKKRSNYKSWLKEKKRLLKN